MLILEQFPARYSDKFDFLTSRGIKHRIYNSLVTAHCYFSDRNKDPKKEFSMYNFLLMAHSGWRYLALLALVVAIVKYLMGWLGNGGWSKLDRQIGLIATIVIDIQLLLGLVLWAIRASGGNIGADPVKMIEHPVLMLVAIAIMHIGQSRVKKTADGGKAQTAAIAFIVAGLLIALGVAGVTGVM